MELHHQAEDGGTNGQVVALISFQAQGLSEAQLAGLPANPAGAVDLTAQEAAAIEGRGGDASCGPKCTTNPIKPL